MSQTLSPHNGKTKTFVRNFSDFVNQVSPLKGKADESIVPFDVIALFITVPVLLAVATTRKVPEKDSKQFKGED